MNRFLLSLLLFSIVTIHLTSSASFPNPPQVPSTSATPEEWELFWKLLHNYYAIIARPRYYSILVFFVFDDCFHFDLDLVNVMIRFLMVRNIRRIST